MAPTDQRFDETGAEAVAATPKTVDYAKIRAAVSAALKLEGKKGYYGPYGIESMTPERALAIPTERSSMITRIANLTMQQGATGDMSTFGGVLASGLGVDVGSDDQAQATARDILHRSTCACHPIHAERAAEAIDRIQ